MTTHIHFMCMNGLENFLLPIVSELKDMEEFKITADIGQIDLDNCKDADIIWLEWANELAIKMTNDYWDLLRDKRVVLRLHSYEIFVPDYLQRIKWEFIDEVVFVADHVKKLFVEKLTAYGLLPPAKLHVVYNGVSLKKFPFVKERNWINPVNIAYVGYINHKKGPMLLLHAMKEIFEYMPNMQLHIAGSVQEERYLLYFEHMIKEMGLINNITTYSWVFDINKFLADKHFIISTSVFEGHPLNVLEAMSTGIVPLIHNFPGAKALYPANYLWSSISGLVRTVQEVVGKHPESNRKYSKEYSSYVKTVYSLESQVSKLKYMFLFKGTVIEPDDKF